MRSKESLAIWLVLVLCNVAGMVDLVALPLWVGSLMQSRALGPQQAGFLVTTYILAVFASSLIFGPRLGRADSRLAAACGFLVGAVAFLGLTQVRAVGPMVALHVLAGLGAGCGLSFTHGAIGRSANPHRLFAMAGFGTGVFGIAFFAVLPSQIMIYGANVLFAVLAGLLTAASIAAVFGFPRIGRLLDGPAVAAAIRLKPRALAFLGVACLATTQAMIFAFIERAGIARGFAPQAIGLMLVAGGLLNLTAPIMASVLDKRVSHLTVAIMVLPVHATFGALAVLSPEFLPYAVCGDLFVWLIIFGHNFMFSFIAKLDPTGRTAATTPAMLMIGSAVGPILGGTLVEAFGYASLSVAALAVAAVGTACFLAISRDAARALPDILETPANLRVVQS